MAGSARPEHDEVSKGKCLTPVCEWKGLCAQCYGSAKKLIDDEETTWGELHELGLAIEVKERFRTEFLKRKQARGQDVKTLPIAQ